MLKKPSGSVRIFYPPLSLGKLLDLLRQRVPTLRQKLSLKRTVLFGSYTKGKQTISSDIDLLIISMANHGRMPMH